MILKIPTAFEIGAVIKIAIYEPPIVIKTDGISIIPAKVPPEVKTDITISAAPPIKPIIVAISITKPLVPEMRFYYDIL